MPIEVTNSELATAAIGANPKAMVIEDRIYSSAQISLDCDGIIVDGGIESRTRQVLTNLTVMLQAGESGLDRVTTVSVQDLKGFQVVNNTYGRHFDEHKPARSTVQVAALPPGSLIEIEAVAVGV